MANGCCKSKSTFILYTVNVLLLLLGIALAAVAGVVKGHQADLANKIPGVTPDDVNAVMPPAAANVGLAGGVLLLVVSIVGLCGARHYDAACGKMLLIVYALFLFAVMALEFVVVGVAFGLTAKLSKYADNAKVDSADAQIEKFMNETFRACCPGGSAANSQGCKLLSKVVADDCQNFGTFKQGLVKFVNARLRMVGIFAIVVAVIQLATLCSTCCLICRRGDKKDEEAAQNPAYYADGAYKPPAGGAAVAQPVQYT